MSDSTVSDKPFSSKGGKLAIFTRWFFIIGTIIFGIGSVRLSMSMMNSDSHRPHSETSPGAPSFQAHSGELENSKQRLSALPPALSVFIDPTARLQERMRIAETGALHGLTSTDEKAALISVLRNHLDAAPVRNQAANHLRSLGYTNLPAELIRLLASQQEKPDFRGWITQHIGIAWRQAVSKNDLEIAKECERSLILALDDRDEPVRREAFLALGRGMHPAADSLIQQAMATDTHRSLTDIAIRLIKERDARSWAERLREIAGSAGYNDTTRILAIHTLMKWQDAPSRTVLAMIKSSASTSETVKRAASHGIAKIGDDFSDAVLDGGHK